MRVKQSRWREAVGWEEETSDPLSDSAQLVLVFGSSSILKTSDRLDDIRRMYPRSHLFGCSTAGEICGTQVTDDSLVVTAVNFEHTTLRTASVRVTDPEKSFEAGEQLAQALVKEGLVHALILSEGLRINGSDLVKGLERHLPAAVTVTGGLSGDGARFNETVVICDGPPETGTVAVVGLYGERLKVGYGCLGGWDSFGPERLITKSHGNVLYELDGKSALELYKRYLGEHADGLPATGLLFPLSIRVPGGETAVVRTILGVSERDQSMTFAGDVPMGGYARLMKANFDRLIDGAVGAARNTQETLGDSAPALAILISCVGRKLVLQQRVEEEVEGVREVLGRETVLTGFYSYGEISPFTPEAKCELHNQTMTITTLTER
ncbi:MAG: FIST C-terminal domain-containing protein [Acidobacteria bacterium]|nr:FIST C-terminal domain-containing protein [Acidobacteriota bacterium]